MAFQQGPRRLQMKAASQQGAHSHGGSDAEAVKPQSMGATLSALEESGLVKRSSDPNDGRQVIFRLTAEVAEAKLTRAHSRSLCDSHFVIDDVSRS